MNAIASLNENPNVENPRFTRCVYALGRRPAMYEFIVWISRCWHEFATLNGCRDTDELKHRFPIMYDSFDLWHRSKVLAGHWNSI